MLFDHEFHEKLLSFVRNIAAILLLGGFAILILYRSATKEELEWYMTLIMNFIGYMMFIWSFYLAVCNVTVLHFDFKKYLLRQFQNSPCLSQANNKNSTSKLSMVLAKQSKLDMLLYVLRYFMICSLGLIFVMIYFLGIIAIFSQQLKLFGFSAE